MILYCKLSIVDGVVAKKTTVCPWGVCATQNCLGI